MAKRRPSRESDPSAPPPAAAPRATVRGGTPFFLPLLRLAVAGALLWGAYQGILYTWEAAAVQREGRAAERMAETSALQQVALDRLRAVVRRAPDNPDNVMRHAVLLLQIENQKARAGAIAAFNENALSAALGEMERVQQTTSLPSAVERKQAEVAAMLAAIATRRGDEETARRYSRLVAEHSREVLRLQPEAYTDVVNFYQTAMRRAYHAGRHDLVLFFHDMYRQNRRENPWRESSDIDWVNRARLELGETPVAMAEYAERAVARPRDPRAIGELIRTGLRYGEARQAVATLKRIDRTSPLSDEVRGYLRELEELVASSRQAQPPTP